MKYKQECQQCGYKWDSWVDVPKQCPKCKRYDYRIIKEGEKIVLVNADEKD